MVVLVPFLLITAVFSRIAIVELNLPSSSSGDQSKQPEFRVEVIVRDTGRGISPEILDQLDTPFFTTKVDGTGLGLAVSRYLVARHGGTLHIESTPGEGTSVLVDLPLHGPDSARGTTP